MQSLDQVIKNSIKHKQSHTVSTKTLINYLITANILYHFQIYTAPVTMLLYTTDIRTAAAPGFHGWGDS